MSGVPVSHGTNTWVQAVGSIQQWEETGARLESAIATYLESCLVLEKSTIPSSLGVRNLSMRLDRRLEYFHALLTQPLAESYSCVARTKNKLAAIYQLPSEILTRIFEFATYHTLSEHELGIHRAITTIYRSLYRIISVCSVWRNVALTHRVLWSVVPLIYGSSFSSLRNATLARMHLERAGCSKLHLAANMGNRDYLTFIQDALVANSSRFGSMNICAKSTTLIENILKCFTKLGSPVDITEMSLCIESFTPTQHTPPQHRIFKSNLVHRAALERTVSSLRVLRMKGVLLATENIFFNNLIELRIQDVNLGRDATLMRFVSTLAHASQLHTLEMISVAAKEGGQTTQTITSLSPFAGLKKLYLEDLTLNVMRAVLHSIAPGPYRLILGVTDVWQNIQTEHGVEEAGIDLFIDAIGQHKVDTLVLNADWSYIDDALITRPLLICMPTLTTIYLDDLVLNHSALTALTRPSGSEGLFSSFPQLRRIYISRCIIGDIGDQTEFNEMLSSHPVEELRIGGSFSEVVEIDLPDTDYERVLIDGPDVRMIPIKQWLESHVPKLTYLRSEECGDLFQSYVWQLW